MLDSQLYGMAVLSEIVFFMFAEILKVIIAKAFELRRKNYKRKKKAKAVQNSKNK